MKKHMISMLFLFFLAISVNCHADLLDFPFVFAQGEAERDVPPDKATITFIAVAFDKDSSVAMETMQGQTREAIQVLKDAEIPDKDITGFNINKEIERAVRDRQEAEILGYYVTRKFQVELKGLDKFNEISSGLIKLNNLQRVDAEFDINSREKVESELVQEAGKDARSKARNMADSMNVKVGSVYSVSEESFRSIEQKFEIDSDRAYARVSGFGGSSETIFVPSTINIRKTINVIFKLETQ